MKPLKTAPQILEHYVKIDWEELQFWLALQDEILKAMRSYAKYKSDIAYEKWFQTALKLYNLK